MPSPHLDVHEAPLQLGSFWQSASSHQRAWRFVVASLCAFDISVATGGMGADARAAAALEANLDLAGGRAAVAGNVVSVITQLRQDSDAVPATGNAMA